MLISQLYRLKTVILASLFRISLIKRMQKKLLSALGIGEKGVIDSFLDEELSLKFLEMGCLPGETILMERIAPMGDPIAIKVGKSSLCMRREEAAGITVKFAENGK